MGGRNPVADLIADKGWCVADGATGSNFFGRGLEAGYPPELWCLEKPEEVAALHDAFLDAGADLILTNSFGGNALRLKLHASEHRVAELNIAAAQLASEATQRHFAVTGRKTLVAGSIGPTGELFVPMGMLDHTQAVEVFLEQATALAEGGADVLWIETDVVNGGGCRRNRGGETHRLAGLRHTVFRYGALLNDGGDTRGFCAICSGY
jgi:5-methyltetrahydrofolate--homocysteine methyltransferase